MYWYEESSKEILLHKFYFQNQAIQLGSNAISPIQGGIHDGLYSYGYIRECIRQNSYSAVLFKQEGVTFNICPNNSDAISFDFSGCFFAKYEIDHRLFIAHIPRMKIDIWNRFVLRNRKRIKGLIFCPTDFDNRGNNTQIHSEEKGNDGIRRKREVWGIISGTNEIISIVCELHYRYDPFKEKDQYSLEKPDPHLDFSSHRRKKIEMDDRLMIVDNPLKKEYRKMVTIERWMSIY